MPKEEKRKRNKDSLGKEEQKNDPVSPAQGGAGRRGLFYIYDVETIH